MLYILHIYLIYGIYLQILNCHSTVDPHSAVDPSTRPSLCFPVQESVRIYLSVVLLSCPSACPHLLVPLVLCFLPFIQGQIEDAEDVNEARLFF